MITLLLVEGGVLCWTNILKGILLTAGHWNPSLYMPSVHLYGSRSRFQAISQGQGNSEVSGEEGAQLHGHPRSHLLKGRLP